MIRHDPIVAACTADRHAAPVVSGLISCGKYAAATASWTSCQSANRVVLCVPIGVFKPLTVLRPSLGNLHGGRTIVDAIVSPITKHLSRNRPAGVPRGTALQGFTQSPFHEYPANPFAPQSISQHTAPEIHRRHDVSRSG